MEFNRNQITSGFGGRHGIIRKLLQCVCSLLQLRPLREKNGHVSYDVSEPSQVFTTPAKSYPLTFNLTAMRSLSWRIVMRCLHITWYGGLAPAAVDNAILKVVDC